MKRIGSIDDAKKIVQVKWREKKYVIKSLPP